MDLSDEKSILVLNISIAILVLKLYAEPFRGTAQLNHSHKKKIHTSFFAIYQGYCAN